MLLTDENAEVVAKIAYHYPQFKKFLVSRLNEELSTLMVTPQVQHYQGRCQAIQELLDAFNAVEKAADRIVAKPYLNSTP